MTAKKSAQSGEHPNIVAAGTVFDESDMQERGSEDAYFGDASATLGDRIAAARMSAGLTQAGLGRQLGVTARLVSSWENDRSEPRANRLSMLSGLVGVSVAWLLAGKGEGVASPEDSADMAHTGAEAARLSLLASDAAAVKEFYGNVLGCGVLAETPASVDIDLFGVALAIHLVDRVTPLAPAKDAPLDDDGVPMPHVALDLTWNMWSALVERLRAASVAFRVAPSVHGIGEPRERAILMLEDADGNAFVFRALRDATSASQ